MASISSCQNSITVASIHGSFEAPIPRNPRPTNPVFYSRWLERTIARGQELIRGGLDPDQVGNRIANEINPLPSVNLGCYVQQISREGTLPNLSETTHTDPLFDKKRQLLAAAFKVTHLIRGISFVPNRDHLRHHQTYLVQIDSRPDVDIFSHSQNRSEHPGYIQPYQEYIDQQIEQHRPAISLAQLREYEPTTFIQRTPNGQICDALEADFPIDRALHPVLDAFLDDLTTEILGLNLVVNDGVQTHIFKKFQNE